jgi:hypothetical protein
MHTWSAHAEDVLPTIRPRDSERRILGVTQWGEHSSLEAVGLESGASEPTEPPELSALAEGSEFTHRRR